MSARGTRRGPRIGRWIVTLSCLMFLAVCCGGPLHASLHAKDTSSGTSTTASEATGIPQRMMAAYQSAATHVTDSVPTCKGMRWQILAGIAQIESHHAAGHDIADNGDITPPIIGPRLDGSGAGGNATPITDTDHGAWDGDLLFDHAVGPFQFLPSTFRAHAVDGNHDGETSPQNADDAAATAADYLCGAGRNLADPSQLHAALLSYNHSEAYVTDVEHWIDQYSTATATVPAGVSGKVSTVLQAALSQQGVPYSWGGGNAKGPSRGICCSPNGQNGATVTGFDCSGLTTYAFAQAGVVLPRTAAAQAGVGRRIPASAGLSALRPGDLVFYGYDPTATSTIHHVGIYLGAGQMINAPRPGTTVRTDSVSSMSDYAGGARIL
jgi:cell wall-associated NlpC family hydrolase